MPDSISPSLTAPKLPEGGFQQNQGCDLHQLQGYCDGMQGKHLVTEHTGTATSTKYFPLFEIWKHISTEVCLYILTFSLLTSANNISYLLNLQHEAFGTEMQTYQVIFCRLKNSLIQSDQSRPKGSTEKL